MPIDLPSMDLPHDSRHQASVLHRTRLLGSWLLAACTALIALPVFSQTASNELLAFPGAMGDVALFMLGGAGDVELYMKDNIAVDRRPLPMLGRYTTSPAKIIEVKTAPAMPEGVKALPAVDVENSVIANAGAQVQRHPLRQFDVR